jgi:hypothetical protein
LVNHHGHEGRPTKSELKQDAIELRRDKVLELTAKGYSQRQNADVAEEFEPTVF